MCVIALFLQSMVLLSDSDFDFSGHEDDKSFEHTRSPSSVSVSCATSGRAHHQEQMDCADTSVRCSS